MQEKKSYFRTIKSLLWWMYCLGCCKQPILLVDLIGSVSIHFLREYVECMVVLIRINKFQDLLVNLRLKSTCDDPSACWFCVYIYCYCTSHPYHLYMCTELSWTLGKKISKKFPKFYILWMVNTNFLFSFLINEQVWYLVTAVLHMILKWTKFILLKCKTNL